MARICKVDECPYTKGRLCCKDCEKTKCDFMCSSAERLKLNEDPGRCEYEKEEESGNEV